MSRRFWMTIITVSIVLAPTLGRAQSSADSASYKKAQILVNDGNAVAGRAIVDSLIARATPGSNEYVEGLYWRAVLSATASEAEMDYRRIIVDYPVSPRVEDVLLRLAQLELARADYAGALQHLNRLTLEHPAGPSRARADYWTARVLFEKNDPQHACAATADALTHANADDTELRNQITYLNQRCAGVVIATAPVTDSISGAKVDQVASPGSTSVSATNTAGTDSPSQKPPLKQTTADAPKPRMPPPSTPRDAQPSMVQPFDPSATAAKPSSSKTSAKKPSLSNAEKPVIREPATDAGEGAGYSVQVAAYNVKKQAQVMVTKLRTKGYEARVSGSSAPFRVRIGHYATEAQAEAVKRSLKAKKIDGFVVKAESR